jgi:hypothetical protein
MVNLSLYEVNQVDNNLAPTPQLSSEMFGDTSARTPNAKQAFGLTHTTT